MKRKKFEIGEKSPLDIFTLLSKILEAISLLLKLTIKLTRKGFFECLCVRQNFEW